MIFPLASYEAGNIDLRIRVPFERERGMKAGRVDSSGDPRDSSVGGPVVEESKIVTIDEFSERVGVTELLFGALAFAALMLHLALFERFGRSRRRSR